MRNQIIIAVALMSVLDAGCFTIVGGIVGGLGDSPRPAPARRAPVEVTGAPGTTAVGFASSRHAAQADTGMSGGAKGVLVGLTIDAVLAGLMLYSLSLWACGDHGHGCSE